MMKAKNITVIGAGTMGHGIALTAAGAGMHAILFDIAEAPVQRGYANCVAFLDKGIARGKSSEQDKAEVLGRLRTSTDLAAAVAEADWVIEAIPERIELKLDLFADLDRLAPAHAILASNTSSCSVTAMAEATERPQQVVGAHFFNPVPLMKLLELIRTEYTSAATIEAAEAFAEQLGKTSVVIADSPGFATSRLGIVIGLEAMRMVEQGVASAADIDTAMELGYRFPMGPLKLTDLVGLDVRMHIGEYLAGELGNEAFRPPKLMRDMVADGRLGKKSGHGFYEWE
jgi:3-hydroxybutyryl-CoA dehydrogenase